MVYQDSRGNSVPYTLEIDEEQHIWIKEHPEIDIDMLLRQTLLNHMRKPAQKKAAEKAAKKVAKLQEPKT